MPNHLFVVRGDVLHLTHDAWLVPTDRGLQVTPSWTADLDLGPGGTQVARRDPRLDLPSNWGSGSRVCKWTSSVGDSQPWLVDVGGDDATDPDWYAEGVCQFLQAAAAELASRTDRPAPRGRYFRDRPLIALPVVGTGWGGKSELAGEVVAPLVATILEFLRSTEHRVDVVVVAREAAHFSAVIQARRRLAGDEPWAELTESLRVHAAEIARHAQAGELVLFVGAGVSAGAGVPLWGDFLDELAAYCGIDGQDRKSLQQLSALDRAEYIERRLHESEGLRIGDRVRSVIEKHDRVGLGHALLAGLPVTQMVTTNYDRLLERACQDAGRPVAVLPHAPDRAVRRWLLKLHGSVDRPADIVLTRSSYLRYETWRSALAGIVQGALLTHRMWFVGFGLEDDNFHRIVDAVRRALHRDDSHQEYQFGWSSVLKRQELFEHLWRGEVAWLHLDGPPSGPHSVPESRYETETYLLAAAARRFEILADLVSDLACGTDWLLDDRFAAARTEQDRRLADLLRPLVEADVVVRGHGAWPRVQSLLRELGAAPSDSIGSERRVPAAREAKATAVTATLGAFDLTARLGSDRVATCYLASPRLGHPLHRREVVLRVLHDHLAEYPSRVDEFRNEGLAAQRRGEQAPIRVFDVEEVAGQHFWVLEAEAATRRAQVPPPKLPYRPLERWLPEE